MIKIMYQIKYLKAANDSFKFNIWYNCPISIKNFQQVNKDTVNLTIGI